MARLFLRGWEDERRLPKRGRRWGPIVVYRTDKWGWLVRRVPTPARRSREIARYWADWLRLVNVLFKYTHYQYRLDLARTERLSGIPARDWFSSALGGLLYVLEADDGRVIYGMSQRERFSRSLDVFDQRRGSLLVRGSELWEGLRPGSPGQVLVVGADGGPAWGDVGGVAYWMWVPVRACGGQWLYEYTDQSRVAYREIRASGEDYAACAFPVVGQKAVACRALYRTMGVGSGSVHLSLRVYAGGSDSALVLVGSKARVISVPGADPRYFAFEDSIALGDAIIGKVILVVEVRRLGDSPEDTYPKSIGFFGMGVQFL